MPPMSTMVPRMAIHWSARSASRLYRSPLSSSRMLSAFSRWQLCNIRDSFSLFILLLITLWMVVSIMTGSTTSSTILKWILSLWLRYLVMHQRWWCLVTEGADRVTPQYHLPKFQPCCSTVSSLIWGWSRIRCRLRLTLSTIVVLCLIRTGWCATIFEWLICH